MGVLNVTPDSFSDGRRALPRIDAPSRSGRRWSRKAPTSSTSAANRPGPGPPPVAADEEIARVVPVVDALRDCGVPLSVDTVKPEVMCAALAAGADMINDINALRAPGALEAVAASQAGCA